MHLLDTRINFRDLDKRKILTISLVEREFFSIVTNRLRELIPRGDFTFIDDVRKLKINEISREFDVLILIVPQVLRFHYWNLVEVLNGEYNFAKILEIDQAFTVNDNFLAVTCTQPICLDGVFIDLFGPMKAAEGEFLYRIVKDVVQSHFRLTGKSANILEIGSYHGKSTACLAQAAKVSKSGNIFAVDKKLDQEFYANIKKYDLLQYVKPVEMPSQQAAARWAKAELSAEQNIHLLFIDGDHTYKGFAEDFDAWAGFVVSGGWILFHDYGLPGVIEGVYEKVVKSPNFTQFGITETIFTARKK